MGLKTNQSRLEKLVGKKIEKVKPKHKQAGYLKRLVTMQFEVIEDALERGCDYYDIAEAISEEINVSPATLKKYHLANKRKRDVQKDTALKKFRNGESRDLVKSTSLTKDEIVRTENSEFEAETVSSNTDLSEGDRESSLRDKLQERSELDNNMFAEDDDDLLADFNIY
jgi:hypothetical protein